MFPHRSPQKPQLSRLNERPEKGEGLILPNYLEQAKQLKSMKINTPSQHLLLKTMRISLLQLTLGLLFGSLSLAHESLSQEVLNRTVTIHSKQQPMVAVLHKIEKETAVSFMYSPELIRSGQKITLDVQQKRLGDVLLELLPPLRLDYEVSGNQILLKRAMETGLIHPESKNVILLPIPMPIVIAITGTITDENNMALPGVSVLVKGTTRGTNTDVDGKFRLNVENANATLVFSYVGYTNQEVVVGNRTNFEIKLLPQLKSLNDVVVIGYGTVKKSDLTGSVVSVKGDDYKDQQVVSVEQALQGRAAGVQVTQADGAPGSGLSIRIRGGNSLQAGNEPLYVIDGIPIYSDNSQYSSGSYFDFATDPNALASLNPTDIESIEILKDASATAIYGARGANGVVMITTKRGKEGRVKVDFSTTHGFQQVINKLDVLNKEQYIELLDEAYANNGLKSPLIQAPADLPYVDYQNEIFRSGSVRNYNLSVSGGSGKTQFAVSGSISSEQGVLKNTKFDRYSLRINLDHKFNNKISFGNSTALSFTDNSQGPSNGAVSSTFSALTILPITPIFDKEGDFTNADKDFYPWAFATMNPLQRVSLEKNKIANYRLLQNSWVNVGLLKGLALKISGGLDYNNNERQFFQPSALARASGAGGIGLVFNGNIYSLLNENTLTYDVPLSIKHKLTLLTGFTQQTYVNEQKSLQASQFVTDVLGIWDLKAGSQQTLSTQKSKWDLLSGIARINYGYNDKYLFTANFRYDGSSRFSKGNKWGFFPSAAFAWKLGNEDFFKNQNIFSEAKMRVSYGITGNAEIGTYRSLQRLNSVLVDVNGNTVVTYSPEGIPVNDLRWEQTAQFDAGLDLGLLKNRLNFTIDYYNKLTDNLLVNLPLPLASGIGTITKNIGSIKNSGLEFSMNAKILNGAFKWTLDANFTTLQNRVTNLGSLSGYFYGAVQRFPNIFQMKVGESVGNFYGLIYEGVYGTNEVLPKGSVPGDKKYRDISGPDGTPDGVINDLDRTVIGNSQAHLFYGFTNTFKYKGFDLSILCQGTQGNDILNYNRVFGESLDGTVNNFSSVLNRWTPQNQNTDIPRANSKGYPILFSSQYLEDGSFFRIKNLSLGYTFNRIPGITNLRVFATTTNLLTVTGYSGNDPEVNFFGQNNLLNGVDWGAYPRAKSFSLGLTVGF